MLIPDTPDDIELSQVVPRPFINEPKAFMQGVGNLSKTLKLLGYDKLRPGQDRAVFNLLHQRDTLAILPTSHGKTAISLVPALCMNWKCLIFSPLIALMHDQVASMQRLGMNAGQISSGQTQTESMMALKGWELGELQFLLVAPERLENPEFLRVIKQVRPNLITVDEAHALSQWSDSFRPSYVKIGNLIATVNPNAVLAMTATCTPEIEADVRGVLGITGAAKVLYMPARRELELSSQSYRNDNQVLRLIEESKGPTIVYCATRKRCEDLFNSIGHVITGGSLVYHGGMPPDVRTSNQNLFMSDDIRVMFATNAFGMGIDKRNIRMILHRDIPGSVEALAQEVGRAARDGQPSRCVQLVSADAYNTAEFFIESSHPDEDVVRRVFHALVKNKDENGNIKKTSKDLAGLTGYKEIAVGAALGILKSSGVVDRESDETPAVNIRILKTPADDKHVQLLEAVKKYGREFPDHSIDLNLDLLLQQTGRKYSTVDSHLRRMDKASDIIYTKPFRGKTTTIKGDLSMVDFDRLRKRKAFAYQKLDDVREYVRVPDEEKHEFLTKYFGR